MEFKTAQDVLDFRKSAEQASSVVRLHNARSTTQAQCYYCGLQWWHAYLASGNAVATTTGRHFTTYDPDSERIRVTVNRVYKNVNQAAAATFPKNIYVDVYPPDSDPGPTAGFKAQTIESAANCAIDYSGLIDAARDANFNRCVAGSWGFGFYISNEMRTVDGAEVPDRCVRAFEFDPGRLILDPANTNRDLSKHEYVIYWDAWTLEKIKRVLGVSLRPEDCKTLGQLMSHELMMNTISSGQLYGQYRQYSGSKAAIVSQVHVRDGTGRFSKMYVVISEAGGDRVVNFDNAESPFGGNGLPLYLLHGQRRPASMWSIGEGQATKEDQDRINTLMSFYFRWLKASCGFTWIVDKRNFPRDTSEEGIHNRITNRLGNILITENKAEKGVPEPRAQALPSPPQHLIDDAQKFETDLQQNAFRSPYNTGVGAKSHVPDQTVARLLEEGDRVLGIRVAEDAEALGRSISLLAATVVRFVQEETPGTLVALRKWGFGEEEFGALLGTDWYDMGCSVIVRESSIRFRSIQSRKTDLDRTAELRFIGPMDYRAELAAMDTPITSADNQMFTAIGKAVYRLLGGEPWQPVSLGEYNDVALKKLRLALFDRRAVENPEIRMLVSEAIVLQERAVAMEQMLRSVPQEATMSDSTQGVPQGTLGDVLNEISGAGPAQGAPQPAAA